MDSALIVLSVLFFTSLILSASMAIAWASFGRPRHALTWALAYGLTAIQAPVNAAAIFLFDRSPLAMAVASAFVFAPCALVAIGARQRAGLATRERLFAGLCLAAIGIVLLATFVGPIDPVRLAVPSLFAALAMFAGVQATMPRGRAASPAEGAMMIAFAAFGLFELVLSALVVNFTTQPGVAAARDLYNIVLAIGLPSAFVGVGIAAILLLASDIAAQLRRLAASDPLTGVLNRRGFAEAAEKLIATARRHRLPIAIAVTDIDRFKPINDRFGHAVGDDTLVCFAAHLVRSLRRGDLVARIGGEEFAMLLVASDGLRAAGVMDRVRGELADVAVAAPEPIRISASFGVAQVSDEGAPAEALALALDRADRALYQSKLNGRDRVTLAEGDDQLWPEEADQARRMQTV